MFDFVEMRLDLQGGSFSKQHIGLYNELRYEHTAMKVYYSKEMDELVVKGSLSYFSQGHNFFFTLQQAQQAVDLLCDMLEVDLWQSRVTRFEYGVVVNAPCSIGQLLDAHQKLTGYDQDIYVGRGKTYPHKQNRSRALKLYSIWANLQANPMKVSTKIKQSLRASRFSPENRPVRCEFRETSRQLAGNRNLLVTELFTPEFEGRCQRYLLSLYNQVEKHDTLALDDRTDTISILLALLSDKDPHYVTHLLELIEQSSLGVSAKVARKSDIRRRVRSMKRRMARYSLEPLIRQAFNLPSEANSRILELQI